MNNVGSLIWQIINTGVLIAIIYLIFYVVFKLPSYIKQQEQRTKNIENLLEEINRRLTD